MTTRRLSAIPLFVILFAIAPQPVIDQSPTGPHEAAHLLSKAVAAVQVSTAGSGLDLE
jgi:hypothetical protein